ncbi:hypothetical protein HPB51_013396 [Rhipicephalus microplus]|uniref:Uncharacterized protein n=1 Tax=Rhipicephalus microplus TaxID=6941 RepID=A0A9J6F380_RHIMP|nr:hypothetical protein HPB51_013396 [Rhipicephalus microplus]
MGEGDRRRGEGDRRRLKSGRHERGSCESGVTCDSDGRVGKVEKKAALRKASSMFLMDSDVLQQRFSDVHAHRPAPIEVPSGVTRALEVSVTFCQFRGNLKGRNGMRFDFEKEGRPSSDRVTRLDAGGKKGMIVLPEPLVT